MQEQLSYVQPSVGIISQETVPDKEDEPPSISHPLNGGLPAAVRALFKHPEAARISLTTGKRTARTNPKTRAFRRRFFHGVPDKEWNDWRWQVSNRIRTETQLSEMLKLSVDEAGALAHLGTKLPMGVTPYYMSLMSADNPAHPLRRTVVPTLKNAGRSR